VLYTDGLEDALDVDNVRFTIEPSKQLLQYSLIHEEPSKINTALLKNVNSYIGEASQFDDITILTVKYHGPIA
jgi:sigma-B regulation protein RsbU (phosphoserine phosphatase)